MLKPPHNNDSLGGEARKLCGNKTSPQIQDVYYEFTENPNQMALAQAYEILFEEVLRIRKNKNGTETNSNLCQGIDLTPRR